MKPDDWKKIILAVFSLIGLATAAGLVFKFTSRKKIKSTKVIQKDNTIGGDNAGRDINK